MFSVAPWCHFTGPLKADSVYGVVHGSGGQHQVYLCISWGEFLMTLVGNMRLTRSCGFIQSWGRAKDRGRRWLGSAPEGCNPGMRPAINSTSWSLGTHEAQGMQWAGCGSQWPIPWHNGYFFLSLYLHLFLFTLLISPFWGQSPRAEPKILIFVSPCYPTVTGLASDTWWCACLRHSSIN